MSPGLFKILEPPLNDRTSSRVVRVSKATGRKDRHSKVLTSKGTLRDRRVRLSVNTAIQFYDLQDRLGFDQPSKALDWLLKVSATSISKLPSLKQEINVENLSNSLKMEQRVDEENVCNGISQTTSFTSLLSGETTYGANDRMDYFDWFSGENYHQQQFPVVNAFPNEYNSGSSDLKVSSSSYIGTVENHHQFHSQHLDNNNSIDRDSIQIGKGEN